MVEVFCGILAGAQYSKKIRTWKVTDRIANLVRTAVVDTHLISDGGGVQGQSSRKDFGLFHLDDIQEKVYDHWKKSLKEMVVVTVRSCSG